MTRYIRLSLLVIATMVWPVTYGAEREISRYLIVNGHSMSGTWDESTAEALRARFGDRFAWFRKDGDEYIITASSVMDEFERAMEPQKKVNRMQAEVNRKQSRVNAHQHDVNEMQAQVNDHQSAVGQDRQKQSDVNAEQAGVNAEQAKVNGEQNKVNEAQERVNEEQQRVSAQFERRVQEILGSALQSGLATRLR